jgi:hypothetical protein
VARFGDIQSDFPLGSGFPYGGGDGPSVTGRVNSPADPGGANPDAPGRAGGGGGEDVEHHHKVPCPFLGSDCEPDERFDPAPDQWSSSQLPEFEAIVLPPELTGDIPISLIEQVPADICTAAPAPGVPSLGRGWVWIEELGGFVDISELERLGCDLDWLRERLARAGQDGEAFAADSDNAADGLPQRACSSGRVVTGAAVINWSSGAGVANA